MVLMEKEKYPFHKVCGEYVSIESWDFLQTLGLPLDGMGLPAINTLLLTAPNGATFTSKLPLGGFGISRHLLDLSLAGIAKESGVHLLEETKVTDIIREGEGFEVQFRSKATEARRLTAKVVCAAHGKRSNLDVKWNRTFLSKQDKRLDNFVGVKYHVLSPWKINVIGLHNFRDGYCGISRIEDNKYCLCYMTKAERLKEAGGSIGQLQQTVLYQNPCLRQVFGESEILQEFPVTISQINFTPKEQVLDGVLMLGDAAGMITPLCGNGMSMAMHSSKLAATLIDRYLKGAISRKTMEGAYRSQWQRAFALRLSAGRTLQRFFGRESLSNTFVGTFKRLPFMAKPVIRMTHGKPF